MHIYINIKFIDTIKQSSIHIDPTIYIYIYLCIKMFAIKSIHTIHMCIYIYIYIVYKDVQTHVYRNGISTTGSSTLRQKKVMFQRDFFSTFNPSCGVFRPSSGGWRRPSRPSSSTLACPSSRCTGQGHRESNSLDLLDQTATASTTRISPLFEKSKHSPTHQGCGNGEKLKCSTFVKRAPIIPSYIIPMAPISPSICCLLLPYITPSQDNQVFLPTKVREFVQAAANANNGKDVEIPQGVCRRSQQPRRGWEHGQSSSKHKNIEEIHAVCWNQRSKNINNYINHRNMIK